jgi:hypothetical protein
VSRLHTSSFIFHRPGLASRKASAEKWSLNKLINQINKRMSQYDDHNTRHPHMSRCLTLIIRYCLVFCEKIQGMSSKITKFTFSDLICYEYNAIYMRIMMYSNLFRLTIVTNKCVLLIKLGITPPNIYHTSIATHNIYIYIYICGGMTKSSR